MGRFAGQQWCGARNPEPLNRIASAFPAACSGISERMIDRLKFLTSNPPHADCSLLQGDLQSRTLVIRSLVAGFHRVSNELWVDDVFESISRLGYHIWYQPCRINTAGRSYEQYLITAWNFTLCRCKNPWQEKSWMVCFLLCFIDIVLILQEIFIHIANKTVA